MPELQVITLSDLAAFTREFVCAQKWEFSVPEIPGKSFAVMLKPLTEEELSEYNSHAAKLAPPLKPGKVEGEEAQPDWTDADYLKKATEAVMLRRTYALTRGMPGVKIDGKDLRAQAKEVAKAFPVPYAAALEAEILRRSTNELAIVNLANFSSGAGSAQS